MTSKGVVHLFSSEVGKKKTCISIVYVEDEAVPNNISHFKCMLFIVGF